MEIFQTELQDQFKKNIVEISTRIPRSDSQEIIVLGIFYLEIS